MKTTILIAAFLALALVAPAGAIDPQPPSIETLDAEVADLTDRLNEATDQLHRLQEQVNTIEDRLGDSYRNTSPFDTIERRLEELER